MKIEFELNPFKVPDSVTVKSKPRPRQEGFANPVHFSLIELSVETLDELCKEFRAAVFDGAKKMDPDQNGSNTEGSPI